MNDLGVAGQLHVKHRTDFLCTMFENSSNQNDSNKIISIMPMPTFLLSAGRTRDNQQEALNLCELTMLVYRKKKKKYMTYASASDYANIEALRYGILLLGPCVFLCPILFSQLILFIPLFSFLKNCFIFKILFFLTFILKILILKILIIKILLFFGSVLFARLC